MIALKPTLCFILGFGAEKTTKFETHGNAIGVYVLHMITVQAYLFTVSLSVLIV